MQAFGKCIPEPGALVLDEHRAGVDALARDRGPGGAGEPRLHLGEERGGSEHSQVMVAVRAAHLASHAEEGLELHAWAGDAQIAEELQEPFARLRPDDSLVLHDCDERGQSGAPEPA